MSEDDTVGSGALEQQDAGPPEDMQVTSGTSLCGSPEIDPEWHSRGYLPHFESAAATQHVTFHLADSLPQDALERVDSELRALPVEKRSAERRRRSEAWIDGVRPVSTTLREMG